MGTKTKSEGNSSVPPLFSRPPSSKWLVMVLLNPKIKIHIRTQWLCFSSRIKASTRQRIWIFFLYDTQRITLSFYWNKFSENAALREDCFSWQFHHNVSTFIPWPSSKRGKTFLTLLLLSFCFNTQTVQQKFLVLNFPISIQVRQLRIVTFADYPNSGISFLEW